MKLKHTPVTRHCCSNIEFYLKRDDWLHPQFSGNKARKFMALLDDTLPHIDTLIGYGSPQANSLYSMAALADLKQWQLRFYVDHIPSWLKQHPNGNYRAALELGAELIETRPTFNCAPEHYLNDYKVKDNELLVPEGGRSPIAKQGVTQLATEILEWISQQPASHWVVALPSGTGTTSLYLHQTLKEHHIEVVTCSCVGGDEYLIQQWQELGADDFPSILNLGNKHHFGKLYEADYLMWQKLQAQTEVEFDLLYDPFMWRCLEAWWPTQNNKQLLYIHQGGILGNESMLPRYQRKYRSC
ncbi:1-aminocyclopropane-1-carboxylate deaminase/D-cysteine desulfhydrase [Vibrio nitrifigilis]|uniref:1-aminocyclopropane-1-carboxylate deaminase/D-cysteine desulfhydrase n=1 Tax=Vibrio nitrifigilis TaxID=2789781 RepID=A0ABS0GCD3_9VIBR|nr:1-aminocyclopropane-1-carboxylate deaminase/D-cysteine desulfhydrase [Vibrio nitrifigilis]MBF9000042.1 1-aminocyclopropane-1-carboxylate deaminase/D-cysteine desulfhydrase [Vibrio nitrifigilis]